MRAFIKSNDWITASMIEGGEANGYVLLPIGHQYHGINYNDIPVEVHCGLTFSAEVDEAFIKRWPELTEQDKGAWVIGFDTLHYGDTADTWPKEAVQAEVERLMAQL